jgi:AAA ATPase domain
MAGALLERDRELTTLRGRLADACAAHGGLIVLEGQAGAGKSALMQALREETRAVGVRACVAVGGELERDFPFGVIRQLLEPVVVSLDDEQRGRLLSGAASRAVSVLGDGMGAETRSDGSFTTLHGLYWFVANLAEDFPLVLLVDDAHWSDEPSLRFLDYLLLHVLAVPGIGEPWAVEALREGARRALREGAGSAAVRRLRRAREEAGELGMALDEIELELGSALLGEGDTQALPHLEAAVASADDAVAAEALRIVLGSGYYHDPAVLVRLLDRAEEVSARLEAAGRTVPVDRLQAQIYAMLVQSPDLTPRRLQILGSPPPDPPPDIAALLAFESCNRGDPHDEVAAWIMRVLASNPLSDLEKLEQPLAFYAMEPALAIDRLDGWESAFRAGETVARRNGSRLATAFLNFMTADWALTVGSVASAEARARAAIEHFAGYGETTLLAALRGTLISALVRRGRLDDAEALDAEMPPDDELSKLYSGLFAFNRRAELRMAQRRLQDAVSELRKLDAVVRAFGWERFCQGYGRQLLARALVISGEREEGLALAHSEVQAGERRAIPGAHAQALISLGHAVEGSEAPWKARRRWRRSPPPWRSPPREQARGCGRPPRSSWGRRSVATAGGPTPRRRLSEARDLAQRTGSTLLVDAASAELLVAGGRPRRARDRRDPRRRRGSRHRQPVATSRPESRGWRG